MTTILVSFDIDGTMEFGEPPGPVPASVVRDLVARGYVIGVASDWPRSSQQPLWARHGIEPVVLRPGDAGGADHYDAGQPGQRLCRPRRGRETGGGVDRRRGPREQPRLVRRQGDAAVFLDQHVIAGWREIDIARRDRLLVLGLAHANIAFRLEQRDEARAEVLRLGELVAERSLDRDDPRYVAALDKRAEAEKAVEKVSANASDIGECSRCSFVIDGCHDSTSSKLRADLFRAL